LAQEYEIEESEDVNPGICIPEEECEEQACNRRRCRRLRRRRCCASRDEDAYWPGKMENSPAINKIDAKKINFFMIHLQDAIKDKTLT
jgi:hypothetical protein